VAAPALADLTLNLHITAPSYSGCDDPAFDAIDEGECADLASDPVSGPALVWVVASLPDDDPAALSAVQFGVDHTASINGWSLCTGGLEIPSDTWPDPGSGTAATWPACYDPPGRNARLGFFTLTDGDVGTVALTLDPRIGRTEWTDCDAYPHVLCDGNLASADLSVGTVPLCEGQPGTLPAIPADVTATSDDCPVTITWTHDGTHVDEFEVRRDGELIATVGRLTRMITDDASLTRGIGYAYTVVAGNGCGASDPSGAAVGGIPTLSPVIACTATDGCGSVALSWDDPDGGEVGFRILRDGAPLTTVGPDVTEYFDATGAFGRVYTYQVSAYDACGDAPPSLSDEGVRRSVPHAPTDLAATSDRCAEVILTWTDRAFDETEVQVWRDGALRATLPSDATTFSDDTGDAGVDYSYVVVAVNVCGEGSSAEVMGSRTGTPPIAPTDLTTTSGHCGVTRLTWSDQSLDEDGFRILRDGSPVATLDPDVEEYVDDDPPLGSPAAYTVVAFSSCGDATPLGPGEGLAVDTPLPPPANVAATDGVCGGVWVSWDDPDQDETGFRVLRDGVEITLVDPDVVEFRDEDVAPETTYAYTVVVTNPCGDSDPSDPDTGFTSGAPLDPVAIVAPVDGECVPTPVVVTWRSDPVAIGYRLTVSTECDGFPELFVETSDTTAVLESLPWGELQVQVASRNACGEYGPRSACLPIRISDPLPEPESFGGYPVDDDIWELKWSSVEEAEGYVVRVALVEDCYLFGDPPDTLYTWEVVGTDTTIDLRDLRYPNETEVYFSSWVMATACGVLGDSTACFKYWGEPPVLLEEVAAHAAPGGIAITWRTSEERLVQGFEVRRRETEHEPFVVLHDGLIPAGRYDYRYLDRTVVAGRTYTYQLVEIPSVGSPVVWATLEATAVAVPVDTRIAAVTPNPFNPQTTLSVEVGVDGRVVLDLFDGAGRRVRRLADDVHSAGVHRFAWDGRDDAGRELGSGTYYARLRAGGVTRVQRLVLVR
jgi:hypothetical protein